jgi:hypothetical protein
MALPRSIVKNAKAAILAVLVVGLLDLGILIYFDLITIPYVSPVIVAFGDSISPFTPLITPASVYLNIKTWLHPATSAYQSRTRRRYVSGLICYCIANLALLYSTLLKFSWFMDMVYGLNDGGSCIGPCWKLWAELVLVALVLFACLMGWDLDGGVLRRFLDRHVEEQIKKDVERAGEDSKVSLGDEESAKGTNKLNKR